MSIRKTLNLQISTSRYVLRDCRSWLLGFRNKSPGEDFNKVICFPIHTDMESDVIDFPRSLHGSKVLDKEAFNKSLNCLSLHVTGKRIRILKKPLEKYKLKLTNIKHIQEMEDNYKKFLFNPKLVRKMSEFDDDALNVFKELNITENDFVNTTVNLTYDNFNHSTVLRAVLPENEQTLTSFSKIGHIVQVNLKPHLLDYKHIIGQVLLDKIIGTRTVINRLMRTETVYRNIEMELLCGDDDYIVNVKENGISYKMDFSKVYWNPRLSTEHYRVTNSLNRADALFDVFCGVGPFSLPAAKKSCMVYANDLNPESVKWLEESIKLNKISTSQIQIFNKDGSDFICNDVKENLIRLYKDESFCGKIVVVMNLPVSALTFIKCFKGLLKSEINDLNVEFVKKFLPFVHCYFFASPNDDMKSMITEITDIDLNNVEYNIHNVRRVALEMDMFRFDVKLPLEYMISHSSNLKSLYDKTSESSLGETEAKKICLSD